MTITNYDEYLVRLFEKTELESSLTGIESNYKNLKCIYSGLIQRGLIEEGTNEGLDIIKKTLENRINHIDGLISQYEKEHPEDAEDVTIGD